MQTYSNCLCLLLAEATETQICQSHLLLILKGMRGAYVAVHTISTCWFCISFSNNVFSLFSTPGCNWFTATHVITKMAKKKFFTPADFVWICIIIQKNRTKMYFENLTVFWLSITLGHFVWQTLLLCDKHEKGYKWFICPLTLWWVQSFKKEQQ